MKPLHFTRTTLLLVVAASLAACSSFDLQQGLNRANADTATLTQTDWQLARTQEQRQQRLQVSEQLLAQPLGVTQAVQLMLANSADFQTMLAQYWAEAAYAAQSGRIANPVFSLERFVTGPEVELNRTISVGLLYILTVSRRADIAARRVEQAQIRLAAEVVDRVTRVRQAWVRAVAANQMLQYTRQVMDSAQASAELARRMEAVGNFNRITRARHQAFYADAAAQMVMAQQESLARREELIRLLGLDDNQASRLQLPERLPEVPATALSDAHVGHLASRQRLDVQLAQASLQGATLAQGLSGITSFTDIELSARRGNLTDRAAGTQNNSNGYEVSVRLPVFDWGNLRRDAMNAQTLAALNNLEATWRNAASGLREAYAAYRSAHDISRHYKDEVLPLRKVIADENTLRYNAMQIGVFELLADARDQVQAVVSAIKADQQFWLADAALQANLIGRPTLAPMASISGTASPVSAGH
jgi:outer membrane protein TolC